MPAPIHTVCSKCQAINRIQSARLGDKPTCGKCGGLVLSSSPLVFTGSNFDRFISKTELPILVDFWAPWCGHCRTMAPAFEQAALALYPHILTAKVNTEEFKSLSARFSVSSLPTLVLFKGGREVKRVSGGMSAQQITSWAKQFA
ncbi:thioredoxin TrxC [Maridesulfovibrio frigidus]|uniref:thioredoxin TrxC n=1 Tax=Maridesulfovibrio frigidus TaxID=340956 RepID=UPI0004E1D52D|nr:thioredoxin TrxC [Maridesulfovibrio frigidus]